VRLGRPVVGRRLSQTFQLKRADSDVEHPPRR
jgi:hypothetical protein